MMEVTLYWPNTGKIEMSVTVTRSALLSVYTEQGMEWAQIPSDENLDWMPNGVRTERPTLAPGDAYTPAEVTTIDGVYQLDLSEVEGTTRITDELGTVFDAPGGEPCDLPLGEYTVEPPHPWQVQKVIVT